MAFLSALLAGLATAPAAVPPLQPIGPWQIEAAENMCLLAHGFGAGDSRITVAFQPMFTTKTMEIIVLTPRDGSDQRGGKATVAFSPTGKRLDGEYFSVDLPDQNRRLARLTVDSAAFDELKGTSELAIKAPPIDLSLHIPSVGKALAAFDDCQKNLLASWGVDPASLDEERAPKPHNIPHLFGSDDYPIQAIRAGVYGRVVTVLQVSAGGKVTNCRVVASAGKMLNDGTCAVAMRATFDPAHDAQGKPVSSIFVLPVHWMLPGS